MHFTIHSKHNFETNKYVLHATGEVEPIVNVDKEIAGKAEVFEDNFERQGSACTRDDITNCKPLPPTNELRVKVRFYRLVHKICNP